jgi:predicted nucleotidyltransferase
MPRRPRAPHHERTADFLQRLKEWAEPREDVRALVVVGSVARGDARPDSDIDVVLLVARPESYLGSTDWVSGLGRAQSVAIEPYGNVVSLRTRYDDGLEVEFSVANADWASAPLDEGTLGVARNGIMVLLDRDGDATALARAVSPSRLQKAGVTRPK